MRKKKFLSKIFSNYKKNNFNPIKKKFPLIRSYSWSNFLWNFFCKNIPNSLVDPFCLKISRNLTKTMRVQTIWAFLPKEEMLIFIDRLPCWHSQNFSNYFHKEKNFHNFFWEKYISRLSLNFAFLNENFQNIFLFKRI